MKRVLRWVASCKEGSKSCWRLRALSWLGSRLETGVSWVLMVVSLRRRCLRARRLGCAFGIDSGGCIVGSAEFDGCECSIVKGMDVFIICDKLMSI